MCLLCLWTCESIQTVTTREITYDVARSGFRTHGVAIDQRLVELKIVKITKSGQVTVEHPSNGNMYPPGIVRFLLPYYLVTVSL